MENKYVGKLINAAEMGLTKLQASALLDIPYRNVNDLTHKYGIKFKSGERQPNGKRTTDSNKQSKAASFNNDRQVKGQAPVQSKATARRDIITPRDRAKRIKQIFNGDLSASEKYEMIYAERWRAFEEQMIALKKRPDFPITWP